MLRVVSLVTLVVLVALLVVLQVVHSTRGFKQCAWIWETRNTYNRRALFGSPRALYKTPRLFNTLDAVFRNPECPSMHSVSCSVVISMRSIG